MSSSELSNALNPYASQSRQRAANISTSPTQQNYTVNSLQQAYNQQQLQLPQHAQLLQLDQYPHISLYDQNQHFDQYQHNLQHVNHVNLQQQQQPQQQRPQQQIPVASVNTTQTQQHGMNQQVPIAPLQVAHQMSPIPIHQPQHTPSAPAPPTHSLWQDNTAILQFLQETERNMKGLERRLQEAEERREAEKRDSSKQMSEIQQLLKKNLEKFGKREEDYDKFKGQQFENDKKRDERLHTFMQDISKKVEVLESANASTVAEVKAAVANVNNAQAQSRSMQYLQQSRQSLSHSPSMASLGPPQYPPTLLPAPTFNQSWQSPSTPQFSHTHSPSPFNAIQNSHPMSHPSPAGSSFNAGSPTSAPSPYPTSTHYSPSPYPTLTIVNPLMPSVGSPADPHSPPASAMSPPAATSPSSVSVGKRKRDVYSDGEDDRQDSEDEDVKPRRLNNHDKRVCSINKAMKVHVYEMMGIVENERLPPPPEEEGPSSYADENAPIRFFWDKTILKSAHNGRMRDRVVLSLQKHKDQYPLLPEKVFNNVNSLKQVFDQTFSTLKTKWKLQNDPKAAGKLREKVTAKTRGSRHTARREEKLRRRVSARIRLGKYDHQIFESAMEPGCMSTEESEDELDPETGETAPILRTHPPAWRSRRLAKFYEKLDADDIAHQQTTRKKGMTRKTRRPGAPKEVQGMLPPNGVSSWMVSRKWVGRQRATRQGFDAQLSGVVGEPVGGVPKDLAGLGELGDASLTESEEEEEEEEEEVEGVQGGSGTALVEGGSRQVQHQTHEQSQLQSAPHQQVPGPGQNQGQVQLGMNMHGMEGFMSMQGPYVSGPSQSVQMTGANTLHNGTQATGLYTFPTSTYYNPATGGFF